MRIGIGHDTHRVVDGRPLILGGLEIPWDKGLHAHSDGDVLLHAVTDALLGAAGLGDIGDMFPDDDEQNRDRDSAEMLQQALKRVRNQGMRIGNIDCIVFAQKPKLGSYKGKIAARIAEILECGENQINVKAKTGELVGPVGRGECLEAQCIALLVESES